MFLVNNVSNAIVSTLKNWGFWSAIVATVAVIILGFILTKKNIIKKEWDKVLIKMVMVVGLPSLALSGFLNDITMEQLKSESLVLLVGFLFYTMAVFGSKIFFLKYEKDVQDTLAMCTALASTTFFGIPIVTSLFTEGGIGKISSNIFNVPYRIFLYSLAFMIMSTKRLSITVASDKKSAKQAQMEMTAEEKTAYIVEKKVMRVKNLKNIFLNPILIATFVGLIIWVTQLIPGIDFVKTPSLNKGVAFSPLRIDLLFPPILKILSTLAAICTPLAWIAIGMQLAVGDFKAAMKSKTVWYGAIIKVIVMPLIILGITCAVAGIAYIANGKEAMMNMADLGVLVIMTATPPASVVVSYAIAYNKEPGLASNLTLVSTLLAVITLPIWVVVTVAIGNTAIFIPSTIG